MQRELNDERFVGLCLYRRDAAISELSSAVNHTAACLFSENYRPISILIERGRDFLRETPALKSEAFTYYVLAEEFFEVVQSTLEIIAPAPE
ncbi:hypothetical protein EN871_04335 [bacterium M00.F.Ca.ET.228.01.1.1]|uniref:hypothetical protein n=1 Tax=Paraburkholderia phenoliruptrix TaxID=252970 RepID=UPI001091A12F|nr:hypothetical protein [Paraburkholderia phenoliruptrix]TGP48029.1 hypothetical protein EN871_04335 [bacterium M00.F.Ca.ET.228.01.1.1]TGS05821.1 hypothetical protein EN834_04335 [bacterium M00.F.Ca.ET.191.01.1.1]TGU10758.1 hypothetical protein EN798_04335 [bacterium M00.F.Ca.ET.155.01.1.1]MBW0445149.1 hypothetical protein [Paraburkholderia phenoliruptrix]MBW9095914.1 hypothetical protein [Paraburkholderia phenoliruptrix]